MAPKPPIHLRQNFDWTFLKNRLEVITPTIYGSDASTGANYGVVFIAHQECFIESMWETHEAAGTDGSAVTLDLEKLESGVALGSGSSILTTALSLKTTANTPQKAVFTAGDSSRRLSKGDRLALKDTGTLTSVAGLSVTIVLKYI